MSNSLILPTTSASPKHEQARYSLPDETERVIYAQRVNGHVRLTDEPAHPGHGTRAYVIERDLDLEHDPAHGVSANAHLQALVNDYLQQATIRGCVPCEPEHPINRILAATEHLPVRSTNPAPYYLFLESHGWEAEHAITTTPTGGSVFDQLVATLANDIQVERQVAEAVIA